MILRVCVREPRERGETARGADAPAQTLRYGVRVRPGRLKYAHLRSLLDKRGK